MDAVGESIANVGLAQEIQKGLSKGMQVEPQWASPDEVSAKESEIKSMGPEGLSTLRLGRYVIEEYETATGKSLSASGGGGGNARMSVADVPEVDPAAATTSDAWDEFTTTAAFQLTAKYMAYADKLAKEPVTHKQFHEARPLGKGAFGAVFLVFKKDTGMALATKKMVKAIAKKNHMIKDVLIEREVLAKIRSRFCVNLHYSYQDDVTIYLVLTLCPGGDLSFLLKSRYPGGKKTQFDPLPDGAVKFYTASMACGLQAIHDAGYVYRDLKPQNVLLDAEGQVRISDMGLTADITGGPIKTRSGTCGYWSPETIKKEPYTKEPDWWSLGVTMFVLFSDKMPFSGKTDEDKNEATCKGEINYKHDEPADLQGIVSALCTVEMAKRLGCGGGGLAEIKAHPYFSGFNWGALEAGTMAAPIQPNINDINAPSAKEIAAFVKPKDVEWTDDDQSAFKSWDMMDTEVWGDEAMARMKKRKELQKAIGAKAAPAGAKTAEGEAPTIAFAKANRESKKGEDFAATVMEGTGAPAAFAVFDGHSGKETARLCSEQVCQRLLKAGPPFTEKAIVDMLWAVDEEIGTSKVRDGATAQMLLVEKDGAGLKGTFAWCGDSSAVMTKMGPGGGSVAFVTESHTAGPDHQDGGNWKEEGKTLRFYGAVRQKVEELNSIDTLKEETTAEMVEAAIKALGETPTSEMVSLLVRAYRRGKIIAETNPQGSEYRKKVFVRQRDKDHDVNQVWVVSTAESRSDPGYSDLQMTRSMCDWRASDMVLPNPQVHSFTVQPGESVRICIASDGLWDVCKFDMAAKEMYKAKSVKSACKNLMEIPEVEYLENRKHTMMDDDTTILVVELNPDGIAPAAAGGGCCEIM